MIISKEDAEWLRNELKKDYGDTTIGGGTNPHNLPTISQFKELEEEVHRLRLIESTIKPFEKRWRHDPGVLRVDLPISIPEIYNMSRLNSVLRTVHLNLKNEIFRRGLRWKKLFAIKCSQCGREYSTEPSKDEKFKCSCGSESFRYPDDRPILEAEKFLVHANRNYQSLIDVFKECEYDLDIIDDSYLILIKEYIVIDGAIVGSRIKEVIRGDPEFLRIVGNEKSEIGGHWWVCVLHRNMPRKGQRTVDIEKEILSRHFESPGNCPICGLELQEVEYVAVSGARSTDPTEYYIKGEIIKASKYSPSRSYGYPPVLSVWKEASTLLNMQHFVNEYFKFMRAPRGILTTLTTNVESAYKKWDQILENIKRDPHYIPFIAIQDTGTGKKANLFQWISFSNTLQEMDYGNVRDELRIRISALYGVSNIMMGDVRGAGGIGNEGLQIVVSDRAVQWGQEVWNNSIFPELCRQFDIFDYILELRPNIELIEQKKLELDLMKVQVAESYWRMGFNVELDSNGELKYSGKAQQLGEKAPPPESKVITQDYERGKDYGDRALGKVPRGAKLSSYA